jgi:adenosylmethionine-8-amino-7-oxononanoate aminotransferase
MTRILHRQISHSYPVAATARGVIIHDSAGKEYIDASGGAAVSCLGHSHPDVLAAMHKQLDQLAYAHTSFFTSQVAEELADDLIAHAPEGISRVFYVSDFAPSGLTDHLRHRHFGHRCGVVARSR